MFSTTFVSSSVRRPLAVLAMATLPITLLAACSSDDDATTQAQSVTISDQWVKSADTGMTAAFGTVANTSGTEVTLTGGTTAVAGRVEVHEMAPSDGGGMVMRPIEGGLDIGPEQTVELRPGGNHIMLMDLRQPIKAGDTVTLTLRFGDGSTREFVARARDFNGAREDYAPGHGAPAAGTDG
ncbi:copper chaperone PCu(A)C [Gordonia sp. YY1]|uniref:copper chaperone PCu(A)C n=1 Tax=Gordonia sp. YY1 TaxID=396712 RepID=UPI0019170A31|nr:copper chaperone PCu(A)C [Gordonia sp. YY1]